jgi:hypothetical protein
VILLREPSQLSSETTENYFDRQYNDKGELTGCSGKEKLDCLVQPVEPQVPGGGLPNMNSNDLKYYLQNDYAVIDDFSSNQGSIILNDILSSEIYAIENSTYGLSGFTIAEQGTDRIIYTMIVSE